MPSYEYHCQTCDKEFDVILTIKEHDSAQVQCPQCHGKEVKQMFTAFTAVTSKKS